MSGTQGRDPIILEGQAAETSVCSYLSCCRICLHLAGTTSPSRTLDGTLPPKRPSDPTLDEAHMAPPGVCDCFQKWGLLKIWGGLKQINIHQSVISSYPQAKRHNKINAEDSKSFNIFLSRFLPHQSPLWEYWDCNEKFNFQQGIAISCSTS